MQVREQIKALQTRNVELQAVMASSDAHASKCAKLGLAFKDEYPDEYSAYNAANAEFNENESRLAELEANLAMEEEAEQLSRLNASEEVEGE